eukprot:210049_1
MASMGVCTESGCNEPALDNHKLCSSHHKQQDGYSYGLDADLKRKAAEKYDPAREASAAEWLYSITGIEQTGSFQEWLKSGVVLCEAINRIKPGTVRKINKSRMPFIQRENISQYLTGCRDMGMAEITLFVTQDLFEGDNLLAVVDNIYGLSAVGRKVGFAGPHIGAKLADKNVREFSEETLQKGKGMMSRVTMGSFGYQPEREQKLDKIIQLDAKASKASSVPSRQNIGSFGLVESTKTVDRLTRKESNAPTAPTNGTGGKFCTECGAASSGKFCGECGNKM